MDYGMTKNEAATLLVSIQVSLNTINMFCGSIKDVQRVSSILTDCKSRLHSAAATELAGCEPERNVVYNEDGEHA